MEEQSENFQIALGLSNFKVFEQAISLFQSDIDENPNYFASYCNMGVAQIHLGLAKKDKEILKQQHQQPPNYPNFSSSNFSEPKKILHSNYSFRGQP